jgi:hypothetical protein
MSALAPSGSTRPGRGGIEMTGAQGLPAKLANLAANWVEHDRLTGPPISAVPTGGIRADYLAHPHAALRYFAVATTVAGQVRWSGIEPLVQ